MHEGNKNLNFLVYDNSEKLKLSMPSRKQKVKISQELLNELKGLDVKYKLN
jgi:DNA polymerase-3 subunit alpha